MNNKGMNKLPSLKKAKIQLNWPKKQRDIQR